MSSDNGQCIEYLLKKVRIRGKFNVLSRRVLWLGHTWGLARLPADLQGGQRGGHHG